MSVSKWDIKYEGEHNIYCTSKQIYDNKSSCMDVGALLKAEMTESMVSRDININIYEDVIKVKNHFNFRDCQAENQSH